MNRILASSVIALSLVIATGQTAFAGDNVQVTLSNFDLQQPTLKINGNQTTQGTIQLWYTVNAFSFPVGLFATFSVDMEAVHLTGASNAQYPAPLTLAQNGSSDLTLSAVSNSFMVSGLGWMDTASVSIEIAPGVSNEDETELVGNLNLSIPGNKKVGTPTSIQVHVLLVHPTACLKVYDFITDQDLTETIEMTTVKLHTNGPHAGKAKATEPGQFSDNVLIANTCAQPEVVDLAIVLDPRWEVQGANGVKSYSIDGEVDPDSIDLLALAGGANHGQALCLQAVEIPAGRSFLTTIHSQVRKDVLFGGVSPFQLGAWIVESGTGCAGGTVTYANPNPALADLPFVVN